MGGRPPLFQRDGPGNAPLVNFRTTPRQLERLASASNRLGVMRSVILREALGRYLDQLEREEASAP